MVICVSNDALSFTTDIFHHYLDIVCVSVITVSSTLEDPVLLTPDLHWTCSPECPPPEGQGGEQDHLYSVQRFDSTHDRGWIQVAP